MLLSTDFRKLACSLALLVYLCSWSGKARGVDATFNFGTHGALGRAVTSEETNDSMSPVLPSAEHRTYEFRVTTPADIISIGEPCIELDGGDLYHHPFGADSSSPNPRLVDVFPSLGVDSFLTTPGSTASIGGELGDPHAHFFDTTRDPTNDDFLFGRLTTDADVGVFRGQLALAGDRALEYYLFRYNFGPGSLEPGVHFFPAQVYREEIEIDVNVTSRPVSDAEIADGLDSEAVVNEFRITTNSDIMDFRRFDIALDGDGDIYNHPDGPHRRLPSGAELAAKPSLGADSFFAEPGRLATDASYCNHSTGSIPHITQVVGPVEDFLFGRVTAVGTGSLRGRVFIRDGENVEGTGIPFELPLGMLNPEPSGLTLSGISILLAAARRRRRSN